MTSPEITDAAVEAQTDAEFLAETFTEAWGERCLDYVGDCACCVAWKRFDSIAAALAAGRAEAVAAGWQTMDTAPKDGTPILLLRGPNRIVVGQWDKDNYRKNPRPFWTDDTEKIWGRNRLRDEPPKGWMPLPGSALVSAPAAEAEPVAWQWNNLGTWHTVECGPQIDAEKYVRSVAGAHGRVRPIWTAAPSASQEALREALVDAAAHLRGAASAYREHAARHRSVGRAKPDPFFTTRADDFDKAADRVSAALAKSAPVKGGE